MRVAVASIYYAPDATGIAPYTTDLCEALADNGAQVQALVGVPHYPSWKVDPAYARGRRFTENRRGVALTRVRHHVPDHVSLLGRARYEMTFAAAGVLATRAWNPDVVIAVTPNLGSLVIAALIARRGAAFGVVVQDLVGAAAQQSGADLGSAAAKVLSRLETRLLKRADIVGVITQEFTQRIVAAGVDPQRVRDLPNYARIVASARSKQEARAALGWPADRILAVHTGNIGQKQNLDVVVEAGRLAAARDLPVEFVIVGDGNQRPHVAELAAGLRTVRILPPVDEQDYPLTLAAADCLVLHERPTVLDMSRPSKLTSYFAAGRPVVAGTSADSASAQEIQRSGAGVVVPPGDPEALLAAVLGLANGTEAERMGAAGRRYAAEELSRPAGHRRINRFAADLAETRSPV